MSSIAENQSNSLRNYVLGILVVVYTFNFIDRQILSILLESIKNDLNLSAEDFLLKSSELGLKKK